MEYMELIDKILTAERNARQLAQDAQEQKQSLETNLQQEAGALRVSYLNHARQKIEVLERQERERTQQELDALDAQQRAALAQVEAIAASQGAQWAENLFRLVVGAGS